MSVLKDKQFEHIVHKIEPQGELLKTWHPEGGVSAQITALEIKQFEGQTKKFIVRRHGAIDLKQNPNIAKDEFRLLKLLQSRGIAAPTPHYLDTTGEIFSTPYIVIEYIEGETEFSPSNLDDYIHQFATHLVKIHRIECSSVDLVFLPKQVISFPDEVIERSTNDDLSLTVGQIRETVSIGSSLQLNETVLLHGDYWPGNILWKNGQLVAVIDWEDAKIGDPLADVANSRLEILWAFGIRAMHTFTHLYKSMMNINFSNLPYWDLWTVSKSAFQISNWGLDKSTETEMRQGLKLFAQQAYGAALPHPHERRELTIMPKCRIIAPKDRDG